MLASVVCSALLIGGPPNQDYSGSIEVLEPKLFNDYALRVKMNALAYQLGSLLNFDARAVREGLFTLQGTDISRASTAFSLIGAPVPSTKLVESNDDSERTTTASERSAPAANATAPPTSLQAGGSLGLDALQRLVQFTNLTYEVANLQSLLQRSADDVMDLTSGDGRLAVVVAIPISINAPVSGCAADLRITASSSAGKVRVISMMPSERTYNYSRLTSDTKQLGLGAAFSLVGFGFGAGSTREKLYLLQDSDAIAQLIHSKATDNAVFGWQFRPVLGKASIDVGVRNMFVVLSIPDADNQELKLTQSFTWYRYDGGKRSVTRSKAVFSSTESSIGSISVDKANLTPAVKSASFKSIDAETCLVSLVGNGFYDGLELQVGPRRLRSGEYENLGNRVIQFVASKKELASYEVYAVSMFGGLVPLRSAATMVVALTRAAEAYPAHTEVELSFSSIPSDAQVFLCVGSGVYQLPASDATPDGDHLSLKFRVPTRNVLGESSATVIVPFCSRSNNKGADPARWTFALKPDLAFEVDSVTPLGKNGNQAVYLMTGRGLDETIRFREIQATTVTPVASTLSWLDRYGNQQTAMNASVVPTFSTKPTQFTILRNSGSAMTVSVAQSIATQGVVEMWKGDFIRLVRLTPVAEAPPPFPKEVTVSVGDTILEIAGDDLQEIKKFYFDSELNVSAVPFVDASGKKLVVNLPAKFTDQPGARVVIYESQPKIGDRVKRRLPFVVRAK